MNKVDNPRRLCGEIQLFDLCKKKSCAHKDGRFCTSGEILAKFEAISDEENEFNDQYLADETEEMEEDDLHYDELIAEDENDEDEDEEE